MNAIPCLCSDRGALSEVVGGKYVLPIPKRFTPNSRDTPNEDETAPWVQKIIELWECDELRREYETKLQKLCEQYASSNAIKQTLELFARLAAR